MHIHPNRMGAIKDSEVKELFLNAKPRRLDFGGSKRPFFLFFLFGFNLLYSFHCRFIIFLFIINQLKCPALPMEFKKSNLNKIIIYLAYVTPRVPMSFLKQIQPIPFNIAVWPAIANINEQRALLNRLELYSYFFCTTETFTSHTYFLDLFPFFISFFFIFKNVFYYLQFKY